MSEAKEGKVEAGQQVTAEQAAQVGGGDGTCSPNMTVPGYEGPPDGFGSSVIEAYDGAVDATSHIIERVMKAF